MKPIFEAIEKQYTEAPDKVAELLYLVLKSKFESSDPKEQEVYVKRLA